METRYNLTAGPAPEPPGSTGRPRGDPNDHADEDATMREITTTAREATARGATARRLLLAMTALLLMLGAACARQTRGETAMPQNDTPPQTPEQTPRPGSPPALAAPDRSGHAPVNGLSLYYEVRGSGAPLVLLHGGLGAIELLHPTLSLLAEERQVIAVDLQAHGRTADIDRPMTCEHMADDIAALLQHLAIERADVMGYSLGGGVALQTAIRHPQRVRKLIVVSTPARRTGWFDEVRAGMDQLGPASADMMKQSPLYQFYQEIAPRPQDFPVLLGKTAKLIQTDYDWSQQIAALKMPVLLVFADADGVSPAHIVEFFALLGGGQRDAGWDGAHRPASRLAILPGTTHYDLFESPLLAPAANAFLDATAPNR